MNLKSYKLEADRELLLFEFFSEGPRGRIKKVVQYAESNLKNFYNLGFGDEHPATKEIDDLSVTNNGDSQQVLTTAAAALYAFTAPVPGCMPPVAPGAAPASTAWALPTT